MNRLITAIILLTFTFMSLPGQNLTDWQKIQSVEDVCRVFPERMETLLQQINLDTPGLELVKLTYGQKQIPFACQLLLDYYRKGTTSSYLRSKTPATGQATDALADSMARHTFIFYSEGATVPLLADGHIDWAFHGSADDIEWAWALNRHHYLETLLNAYLKTGNPLYAQTIDRYVKDWIISSMPYPGVKSNTEMWRGLEVCARAKNWAKVFFGLMDSGLLSPATQLLMLSSLPEHAHYMRNFHQQGNWLTMEMTGLATVATAWPEFRESAGWFKYAVASMTESLKEQVYPDGVQTELTSHYHHVALSNFSQLVDICKQANQPLPESYLATIENMWNYLAYTMRPDGLGLMNNDSDQNDNREVVEKAAKQYQREDWKYIATNGREGSRPVGMPSVFFPWAGQLIMRSDYDPAAQWAFFDIGPWGTGHQHNDKLNLTVVANGQSFLVDGGRFAYRGEISQKFGNYARGSASHNLILVDGQGQEPGPRQATELLTEKSCTITDRFDCAWNFAENFAGIEGICSHSRVMFYVRGEFWVVVDRIASDRPRKIETLWHWHPECTVSVDSKQTVTAQNGQVFLQIVPAGNTKWFVDMVKGQSKPSMQGWYSKGYNLFEPNTTSIYTSDIPKEASFAWILYPSMKQNVDIQARIVSENKTGMVLQVTIPGKGQWKLNIPFTDSSKASLGVQKL